MGAAAEVPHVQQDLPTGRAWEGLSDLLLKPTPAPNQPPPQREGTPCHAAKKQDALTADDPSSLLENAGGKQKAGFSELQA
jgi:hypothetical protein